MSTWWRWTHKVGVMCTAHFQSCINYYSPMETGHVNTNILAGLEITSQYWVQKRWNLSHHIILFCFSPFSRYQLFSILFFQKFIKMRWVCFFEWEVGWMLLASLNSQFSILRLLSSPSKWRRFFLKKFLSPLKYSNIFLRTWHDSCTY